MIASRNMKTALFLILRKCLIMIALIVICSDAMSTKMSLKKRVQKLELEFELLEEVNEKLRDEIKANANDVQNVNETIKKNDLDLTVLQYAIGGTIQDVKTLDDEMSMYFDSQHEK